MARQASDCPQVVLFTDALYVLESLDHNKLEDLSLSLLPLCATKRVVLQWLPSHCGIHGHEVVDQLAKEGARS